MNNFEALIKILNETCPELELRREEPMSRHTSFRIGGPAALMALPKTEEEAKAAVKAALQVGVCPLFLGNGSNLLVSDKGLNRFVIKAEKLCGIQREGETGLWLGAGALLSQSASFARDLSLTGLEFAHGIPGSVGGAVVMNAGAYGGEMRDVITAVICLTAEGEVEVCRGEAMGFGYRKSAFEDGSRLVLGAVVELQHGDPEVIRARMEELSFKRRDKQPLEYPSAGSTFKRPENGYAAALIDSCGLKGLTVGGAQVSEKHAGFVINKGGATCEDVLVLMKQIHDTVLEQTGISLEPEVRILGE